MTDKHYIESMVSVLGLTSLHIIECDGADKIKDFLKYHDAKAQDLSFTPEFVCVLDNDSKGRDVYNSLEEMKFKNIKISPNKIPRYNGKAAASTVNWEIEDFIPPKFIFDAVNKILKRYSYNAMADSTLNERSKTAYADQEILTYFENAIARCNLAKDSFPLNKGSMKREICELVCKSILDSKNNCRKLLFNQTGFLKSLS